jgi:two-component system cell cycle response regulator CtrA
MTPVEMELRLERDRLRLERDRLRDLLAPPGYLPASLGLTPTEERAFKALVAHKEWEKEAFLTAVYLDTPEDDMPDIKMVDVLICKLRKKLEPFGLEIETLWKKGFRLSPPMRMKAALLVQELAA